MYMEKYDCGYCIWLLCEDDEDWSKRTNGFKAHMSICTHMTLTEALDMYSILEANASMIVEAHPGQLIHYNKGFNALYYNIKYSVKNSAPKPWWWPNNAHVSLQYKYDEPFGNGETKSINLVDNECKMKDIIIMKCAGKHKTWKWIM
ncbi:MAG: hypothetical protein CXT73_04960 [Methanobacteriota archaeon]|nr:MAG: hypothetical protein CXT73_04960 [Euryarchaeota archaeon]